MSSDLDTLPDQCLFRIGTRFVLFAPNARPPTRVHEQIGWDQPFRGGVFDNKLVDGPGVIAISKLPTKQELYQRIAVAINLIPTKVGRSIKLVPTKVGRAVKLAFAEEGEGGDGSEGAAAEEAPAAAEAAEEVPATE